MAVPKRYQIKKKNKKVLMGLAFFKRRAFFCKNCKRMHHKLICK